MGTKAVSVKVAALRKDGRYADFGAWRADVHNNLYVGRRGRIFVHEKSNGKKTILHYSGSKWQNPFSVGKDGTREEVCRKFKDALLNGKLCDPDDGLPLRSKLGELRGLELGCWCKPEACHADILAELANNNYTEASPNR